MAKQKPRSVHLRGSYDYPACNIDGSYNRENDGKPRADYQPTRHLRAEDVRGVTCKRCLAIVAALARLAKDSPAGIIHDKMIDLGLPVDQIE